MEILDLTMQLDEATREGPWMCQALCHSRARTAEIDAPA